MKYALIAFALIAVAASAEAQVLHAPISAVLTEVGLTVTGRSAVLSIGGRNSGICIMDPDRNVRLIIVPDSGQPSRFVFEEDRVILRINVADLPRFPAITLWRLRNLI